MAGASGNTLIAGTLGVAGATTLSSTVDVTDDFNVNSKFTVTAASGDTAVAGTLGVTGISTFADEVKLANDNALVTHTGSTGMKITSSSGYVDVESVRFTGLSIGKDGDPNTILLANQQVTITGALDVTSNVDIGSGKFVVTASDGSLAIATDKFKVAGASGDTLIAGTLGVTGATTMSSTLGVVGDFDIGPVGGRTFEVTAVDGSLDINSGKLTVAGASGNTLIAGTLGVAGATTLSDTLAVSGDVTVNTEVTASDGSLAITTDKFTVAGGSGNTLSKGTLGVEGDVSFGPSTGRTFEVTASDGSLDINSGKLTVAGASGDTLIAGTLGVAEATTLSDTLAVSGDVTVNTDKFKVTADDGSLAIATDKFTVAGASGDTLIAARWASRGLPRCRARWVWWATSTLERPTTHVRGDGG